LPFRRIRRQAQKLTKFDFALNQFDVSLGFNGRFNIGLAKGQFGIRGYAYFNKVQPNAAADANPNELPPEPYISVIDSSPTAQNLRHATNNRIDFEILEGTRNNPSKVVYHVPSDRFMRDLNRASDMTAWILKTSDRYGSRRWRPFMVQPEFVFSIEDDAGFATLGGQASLELTYRRP
jgi:hypothetical protein